MKGLAEHSIRTLEEQACVHLAALKARISMQMPSGKLMRPWVVEHAAFILNLYQIGLAPQTALRDSARVRRRPEALRTLGGHPMVCSQRLRPTLDQQWRYGMIPGVPVNTGRHFVGLADCEFILAKAILRHLPETCWCEPRVIGL